MPESTGRPGRVLRFAKPVSKARLGLLDNACMVQARPWIGNCFLGAKNPWLCHRAAL